ncbi:unnamed protein product [Parascedosporium putredinis]|uniref:Uncharacterized protein n=1 Tax=Parascedosporium putredinis TaxID=1442378 RepID=A0A9P1H8C3_9PEZI|nr:unnamed protein product [Parascedosporium putredinis]CAI8000807.1 unnamed protein product [Parascedosporium putredinis]
MLQAPNGRLIYLGDSATLSCLQILRFIVGEFESCDFTDDPSRHKFMENMVDFDSNQELPGGINPPTSTVEALLTSFLQTHMVFLTSLIELISSAPCTPARAILSQGSLEYIASCISILPPASS